MKILLEMRRMKKTTAKKAGKLKRRFAGRQTALVLLFITMFSLFGYKIYCNAQYNEMTNQLSSLKRQYEVLENEEIQLQVSQDSKANLRTVEEIASGKLGMRKIEQYLVSYVNLENEDRAEVIDNSGGDGFFGGLFRNFAMILEYLS